MALSTFVIPSGKGVQGQTLSFNAYSLRVDNLSGQWLQEQTTLSWIPPYSLGNITRLYGTGVALILNEAPWGQPQPGPVLGEYAVAVYSDELRTETAGTPVREYSLVQAVTDLTEGAQPAWPAAGVDRLYADTSGNIHHLHSNGQDLTLVDASNVSTALYPTTDPHYQAMINASIPGTALGGDLNGTISNGHVGVLTGSHIGMADGAPILWPDSNRQLMHYTNGGFYWDNYNSSWSWRDSSRSLANVMTLDQAGNLVIWGNLSLQPSEYLNWGDTNHKIYQDGGANHLYFDEYGQFVWRASSQSFAVIMTLDQSGNLNLYGTGGINCASGRGAADFLNCAWLRASTYYIGSTGSYIFPNSNDIAFRSVSGQYYFQSTGGSPGIVNVGQLQLANESQNFYVGTDGTVYMPGGFTQTTASSGGASGLPGNPDCYWIVNIPGRGVRKIPCWAP